MAENNPDGVQIEIPKSYRSHMVASGWLIAVGLVLLIGLLLISISVGAIKIPLSRVLTVLLSPGESTREHAVILGIRLPQVLTALTAGGALALAGAVMQIILQNPLGSPFTLGISNAAAFGAAFSVLFFSAGAAGSSAGILEEIYMPFRTTIAAFAAAMLAAAVILLISHLKKSSPEVMVLVGVALSSLFSAAVMLLQYFADDIQLSAMVFWTFGDTARVSWNELIIMGAVFLLSALFFVLNRWNFQAMLLGDETAHGLGVAVSAVRLSAMSWASLVTAVVIAFAGVIGFIGLAAPHIARRLMGEGNRWYLAGTVLTGSILLTASDLTARLVMAPRVLPAAIVTAFLGAPIFIYLLIRGYSR